MELVLSIVACACELRLHSLEPSTQLLKFTLVVPDGLSSRYNLVEISNIVFHQPKLPEGWLLGPAPPRPLVALAPNDLLVPRGSTRIMVGCAPAAIMLNFSNFIETRESVIYGSQIQIKPMQYIHILLYQFIQNTTHNLEIV